MATEKQLLSQWYEALSKEDSLRVQALLADHPNLLKLGWGDGALQFQGKKPWKQRTALHVGVKRGNAELVDQVLMLCKVDIPRHSSTKEGDKGNPPSTDSKGQTVVKDIAEAPKNAINNSGPSQHDTLGKGDRQLAKVTLPGSDQKPAEKTGIEMALLSISGSKREEIDKGQKMACLAVAKWRRKVSDSRFVQDLSDDKDECLLRSLLTAKDGEYNLDAIAIAALHGNHKIFLLILYAMGKCELHDVKTKSLPALDVTDESKEDRDNRAKLREATAKIVWKMSREDPASYGALCLEKYKEHSDFNFLPWQEYLFHFLFAREIPHAKSKKEFGRALWNAIRSCPGSTWRFVLRLLDGQGRTRSMLPFAHPRVSRPLLQMMEEKWKTKLLNVL